MPITDTVQLDEDPTLPLVVQAEVHTIRTDLDRFSDEEINGLAQHGYEVARKVYRETHEGKIDHVPSGEGWAPIPSKKLPGPSTPPSRTGAASPVTTTARRLRKSSVRRVWSTLLDPRDWPSYLYIALAIFLLGYLPLQVYKLYRKSQMQAVVIDSIASGNPDIHDILSLLDRNPIADWQPMQVEEIDKASETDVSDVEILDYSRILDFREWRPELKDPAEHGGIYIKDRVMLRIPEDGGASEQGDARVRFSYPSLFDNLEFRQPEQRFQAEIRRLSKPEMDHGIQRRRYEVEYDLKGLPRGEPATVQLEMLARIDTPLSRAPFVTRFKTDLLTVWMLFPEDRPYQNFELVSYPSDRSEPPTVMSSRYKINHPYGSLIGWSVVNPELGQVYECRWTNEK
ncbi:hypothetical protein NG895_05720 [Aeoliella sp. ICT_H6.2]|uniref:Uncharacterized protein n=1 Tax=Aeoliella straminimaris TaxID=2954799 RepID=A0A9X2FBQ2_9BACT|nr:hypothetical protein [Aeoliella straminimaris]MCO6043399.1 hypothetical protein [Aeoliella straminimaris]